MVFKGLVCVVLLCVSAPAWAQFGDILGGLKDLGLTQEGNLNKEKIISSLSKNKIASGLKEALQVGTQNTVNLTGKLNGFLENEAIKILMPQQLQSLDQALRLVGYGPQVDDFVTKMNRAAEQAAPLAQPIFQDAIKSMSFADVNNILHGGDTAATDYFQAKTSKQLEAAFRPVVEKTMNQVGVVAQYKELVGRYQAIPFVKTHTFDLDHYVVDKSLNGLFTVLSEEERKIRTDPTAQVTDLLKEVFSK